MKEKIKKYKWKERLICLGIAYEIFLVRYMITQINNPSRYVIYWATDQILIPLMMLTFLVLIFNWKIVAIGFPVGYSMGLIFVSRFGVRGPYLEGVLPPNHVWIFLLTCIITTLVAIGLEITYRVKRRSKAELAKTNGQS